MLNPIWWGGALFFLLPPPAPSTYRPFLRPSSSVEVKMKAAQWFGDILLGFIVWVEERGGGGENLTACHARVKQCILGSYIPFLFISRLESTI